MGAGFSTSLGVHVQCDRQEYVAGDVVRAVVALNVAGEPAHLAGIDLEVRLPLPPLLPAVARAAQACHTAAAGLAPPCRGAQCAPAAASVLLVPLPASHHPCAMQLVGSERTRWPGGRSEGTYGATHSFLRERLPLHNSRGTFEPGQASRPQHAQHALGHAAGNSAYGCRRARSGKAPAGAGESHIPDVSAETAAACCHSTSGVSSSGCHPTCLASCCTGASSMGKSVPLRPRLPSVLADCMQLRHVPPRVHMPKLWQVPSPGARGLLQGLPIGPSEVRAPGHLLCHGQRRQAHAGGE